MYDWSDSPPGSKTRFYFLVGTLVLSILIVAGALCWAIFS